MKKITFLKSATMALVMLCSINVFANPVGVERAEAIGKKFLLNSVDVYSNRPDISLELEYTQKDANGNPVLYVFNVDYKGFVIVSAEDRVSPILGYSFEGNFDAENISPNAEYILGDYQWTIDYVRSNKMDTGDEVRAQWEMVESTGRVTADKGTNAVEPLLSTTWNQNAYYNDLCPEDPEGPNGRVYAGCVATAMAQVINYWNYPAIGNGSHTFTPYGYPTQTANFGETFYDYTLMPDNLDENSSEEEVFQVAQLMWHCGIGVDMMYGNDGSGAYSSDVPYALINYFLYSDDMSFLYRPYNDPNWNNQLRANLDEGMPIYYSGSDVNGAGGHAFVCDGYDDNNMFHFNLGWSGNDNGYYPSNAINTEHGPYYFNSSQAAIFNVTPNESYWGRPAAPTNLVVTPAPEYALSATISWSNPTITMNAEPLSLMDIVVKRNDVIIATMENVNAGEELSVVDDGIEEFGAYTYYVYAVTEDGEGVSAVETAFIGPSCTITIDMHDTYGDGWNGASITLEDENGSVLGTATVASGEHGNTEEFQLPLGIVNFIWNEGNWDSECSFEIYNNDGEVIYDSTGEPVGGQFFSYDNQCMEPVIGDANGDLSVDVNDITTIVLAMLGQEPANYYPEYADYNADGIVNILDIVEIVNYIMSQK